MLLSMLLLALQQGTSGSVEIVVRDANSRAAIPGVPVTLTFKFPNEPAGQSVTMATDSRGLVNFSALAPGNYLIRIAQDGIDARGMREYVFVDPGDRHRIEILVKRTASASGRVLTPEGKPSVGTMVTLNLTTYRTGRQTLESAGRATTNSEGRFEFTLIPFGNYYLRMESVAPEWAVAYYPGESDLSAARKVSIWGRDVPLGDMTMPHVPRFKALGVVAYAGTNPSRTVRFHLAREYPNDETGFTDGLQLTPEGPNEARFEIAGLTSGTWLLTLMDFTTGLLARETLVIGDRDLQDIRITMKPPIEIRGKVVVTEPQTKLPQTFRVTSPARESIPSLLLNGFSRDPAMSPNGEFVIGNLMEGARYGFSVGPLPPDAYLADIRWGVRSILADYFFVAGASEEAFEIHIAGPGATIKGTVRDAAGSVVAAAHVTAVPEFRLRKNPLLYKRSAADAQGQFVIRGLAPGEYQVFAWAAPPFPVGTDQDPAFLGLHEPRSMRVRAIPGTTVEGDLRVID